MRNLQKFCEELDAGLVGTPVGGWCGHGQFQRIPEFARDGILFGAGMNLDGKCDARGSVEQRSSTD